jgi:hypothetical protein
MLHQVGVSFDLYYDARKHKIKIKILLSSVIKEESAPSTELLTRTAACSEAATQAARIFFPLQDTETRCSI